jgi:hypothetical protein
MVDLPRFVRPRPLAGGRVGFYWIVANHYRKQGCTIPNEPLGEDYSVVCERAAILNGLFDEWRAQRSGEPIESTVKYGTVDWLFREYRSSKAYLERVAERSRPDYERTMLLLADTLTKKGDRVGGRSVRSITPVSADKLYEKIINGPQGERLRQGEKLIILCRRAWKVVRRLYPDAFDKTEPNPWTGVTMRRRVKKIKAAVDRETVYAFAWKAIEAGHPEVAAVAVICFEWLQRPENVLQGCLAWTDYRGNEHPTMVRIFHHKTGAIVWHPLEEMTEDGMVQFYSEAEAILAKVPRRGPPMILQAKRNGTVGLYKPNWMAKLVRRLADDFGLPSTFTLDACRHGGMTEIEEQGLTTGEGKALSGHRSDRAYGGYAKFTPERALAATRKRHAHRLQEQTGAIFRNKPPESFRNDGEENESELA